VASKTTPIREDGLAYSPPAEDVAHNAILIRRTPKIVPHTLDPDEHLVQVSQAMGVGGAAG
jgi:hypothetical protein